MKLSLAMICKDELDNLKEIKPLVEDYIDEWVVVFPPDDPAIDWAEKNGITAVVKDFTQPIEPEVLEEMQQIIEVPENHRLFNFANARNESFSKATGDYIMWLDADDRPKGLKQLRETLETDKYDVIDVVYDYARDLEGNSISDHVRERVVRNNGKFEWRGGNLGLIHETIVHDQAYKPKRTLMDKEDTYIEHHSDHQEQSSARNFVALMYEYFKTDGKDPRTTYYLGTELFNHKMYADAINILREYTEVGGWDEERYRAYIRMAEAYHQLGHIESSRNAYLQAQKEMPGYPDAYLGLGESFYDAERWDKAIEYTMTGLQKPVPETKSAIDMVRYTFRPLIFVSLAYLQLGKPDQAYKWFSRAKKLNPKHPWVNKYEDLFNEAKDVNDYVRAFTTLGQISKRLYPDTMGDIAEIIPDELMDQEILLDFKRRFAKPKKWPEKSVVIFASRAFEEWGPDSLETGCGGSEEAVIQLTKRWADMGYDVTVFNNCPEEKTVDGVTWKRYERFNPNDEFDVLISWRNNAFLEPKNARVKLYDLHDVPNLGYMPPEKMEDVTLMVKSEYHKSLFTTLPDADYRVINNGIEPEQFENNPKKNNLVWTSSYDRGLEHLLKMWPDIKEQVPDATLDIYYGFNLFDQSAYGKSKEGKTWKKKMIELMDQDGITEHGRVNTHEIAKAYNKADVWAYPTDFPEIDCITATKAMAAGCVPITTDFAVMKERNQGIMIEGDINDPEVFDEFRDSLIDLLQDDKKKQKIRKELDVSKFSWDSVAERWADEFTA